MTENGETLRLAVISTPRSGNCWLRHMLAESLELQHIIAHLPTDVPWNTLPDRAVLQLHWLPSDEFRAQLNEHGFQVVVLARHPLDVLISILAFSQHDDSTLHWLDGAGGNERSLAGASPLDPAFLEYATGPRAQQLLNVSVDWWKMPHVHRVHYEELLLDPAKKLAALIDEIGASPRKFPYDVAARSTPDDLRGQNVHMLFHVWQAQGSLWRRFLTADVARKVHRSHERAFSTLEYACDPNPLLFAADARANWSRHDAAAVKKHLHGVKKTMVSSNRHNHLAFEAQRAEIAQQKAEIVQLSALVRQLADQQAELQQKIGSLGPWSIGTAKTLQRWANHFPRSKAAIKATGSFCRRRLGLGGQSAAS